MKQELRQQDSVCKTLDKVNAGPETALDWLLREHVGEAQPATAWVAHIVGSSPTDARDFTITLHETGDVEDPTNAFQRDGLPGPATAFALEAVWTQSGDPRFHPMDRRWCHPSFWLSNLVDLFNFCPEKYSIGMQSIPKTRLWPPSSRAPLGRPRTRPMKKKQQSGPVAMSDFLARGENGDMFGQGAPSRASRHCTLCGSSAHDRRNCRSATSGDVFSRQLSRQKQLEHVRLPLPPPDGTIDLESSTLDMLTRGDTGDNHQYFGRAVIKFFKSTNGRKKRRPYSGVVGTMWMESGIRRYTIHYDDGDEEDVSAQELRHILIDEIY